MKRLSDLTKHRREKVTLEVTISEPDCEVTWSKNDRKLESSAQINLSKNGVVRTLLIPNATFDDEGRYTCELNGEKTHCNLKILELELAVQKKLTDFECPLDGDAYFETILNSANAEPVWKKDGRQLSPSDNIIMEEKEVEVTVLKFWPIEVYFIYIFYILYKF